MSKPDDTILILVPSGGGFLISREVYEDAIEMGAPIREYLANLESERA